MSILSLVNCVQVRVMSVSVQKRHVCTCTVPYSSTPSTILQPSVTTTCCCGYSRNKGYRLISQLSEITVHAANKRETTLCSINKDERGKLRIRSLFSCFTTGKKQLISQLLAISFFAGRKVLHCSLLFSLSDRTVE